jgi:hypothetical protein
MFVMRQVLTISDIRKLSKSDKESGVSDSKSYHDTKDGYFDRLFKYIPAEMVAGYIFVLGTVNQLSEFREIITVQWVLFILFCILTPLYLWRVQKVIKLHQQIISLILFAVWVFSLGGPFAGYNWYNPLYGALLLPVFTLVVAIIEAEK